MQHMCLDLRMLLRMGESSPTTIVWQGGQDGVVFKVLNDCFEMFYKRRIERYCIRLR